VVFKYGTGCPEDDEEKVTVTVFTGESSPKTSSEIASENTTTEAEEYEYLNTRRAIEDINEEQAYIVINNI